MSSAAIYSRGPLTLHRRHLSVDGKTPPTRAVLKTAAKDLLALNDSGAWGIGDLMKIAKELGAEEPVNEVIEDVVRDRQMARKRFYVAQAFNVDQRSFDLWWSFYYAVYTFPEDVKARLLKLAEDQRWSLDEFKKHLRGLRHSVRQESQTFPEGQYGLLYVDPPWKYDNEGVNGAAVNHYPPMETEAIRNFSDDAGRTVQDLAAKNSVLYMWATNPFLEDAIGVGLAWGFEYKSNYVWVKDIQGPGFWNRGRHELLLIFTKGKAIPPAEDLRLDSVIQVAATGDHSAKPAIVYEMLETLHPKLPRIEIFARTERPGWSAFGNQLPTDADRANNEPAEAGDEQAARETERAAAGKSQKKKDAAMEPRLVKGGKKKPDAADVPVAEPAVAAGA